MTNLHYHSDSYFTPDLIWELYSSQEINELIPGPFQGPHQLSFNIPLPINTSDWED